MSTARAYRPRGPSKRSEVTRGKIMSAVRGLLAEGKFHEATVDEVADRAGIARATLYQHFRSRLDLVDAICESFAVNPALVTIREVVELEDPDAALAETVAHTVRFWSSEDPILAQLYGVSAVDPAARDLVDRQRADRRGEMQRLVRHLHRMGRLRHGLGERRGLALLMVLTSYESYSELLQAGLPDAEIVKMLQQSAVTLLFG